LRKDMEAMTGGMSAHDRAWALRHALDRARESM
jgi:hypothetical protein